MPTRNPEIASLRVMKRLAPDQPGARKLTRQYHEALVCVRHRVDDTLGLRYTTVELLVETTALQGDGDRAVAVRIRYDDGVTRARAIGSGARWDPTSRLWHMPLRVARALKLQRQIVPPSHLSTDRHLKSVDP